MKNKLFIVEKKFYKTILNSKSSKIKQLEKLAAVNRINALTCIKSAEHGWIGATYSVAETLTYIYFGLNNFNVILSKGHAAAMQYACLYGLKKISEFDLLSYKNGVEALQAHTDISTPGIFVNTGSLGQSLSKTIGLAMYNRKKNYYVVLGDGELQEGQIFEAFQSLKKFDLKNVTIIIDRNHFQSDSNVKMIKEIPDFKKVTEGFGLKYKKCDGHNFTSIKTVFSTKTNKPLLIDCETVKGGGSEFTSIDYDTPFGKGDWHSKVPDFNLYIKIIEEQLKKINLTKLNNDWAKFKNKVAFEKHEYKQKNMSQPKGIPTKLAFNETLEKRIKKDNRIVLLDADLAKSTGCNIFNNKKNRFLEMGIAEQDMVSVAGGLALEGYIPIVNTYAAFYKRAYEQVYVNATENTKIIYAGHYSGIDYFSDGKTHQSITDIGVMRMIPNMVVIDPVNVKAVDYYLNWAINTNKDRPVYFRLRRTPLPIPDFNKSEINITRPLYLKSDKKTNKIIITSGTVALNITEKYRQNGLTDILVQQVYNLKYDLKYYKSILKKYDDIYVIEDNYYIGGLKDLILDVLNKIELNKKIKCINIDKFGWSFRTFNECKKYFGLNISKL